MTSPSNHQWRQRPTPTQISQFWPIFSPIRAMNKYRKNASWVHQSLNATKFPDLLCKFEPKLILRLTISFAWHACVQIKSNQPINPFKTISTCTAKWKLCSLLNFSVESYCETEPMALVSSRGSARGTVPPSFCPAYVFYDDRLAAPGHPPSPIDHRLPVKKSQLKKKPEWKKEKIGKGTRRAVAPPTIQK